MKTLFDRKMAKLCIVMCFKIRLSLPEKWASISGQLKNIITFLKEEKQPYIYLHNNTAR